MAGTKRAKSWERLDQERLASAVRLVSRDENLRYFFRTILDAAGINYILPADNALLIARAAGKHELGLEIIATFQAFNPRLWPQMLIEEHNETLERLASVDPAKRPDRGEPDGDAGDDSSYE